MNNLIRENETRVILYYYENKDLNNEVILDKEEFLKAIPSINKTDISTINSVLSRNGLIETKQGSKTIKLKIPNIVHIYPQLNFTYLCNNFEQLKDLPYKEKQLIGYFIYISENQNKQFTTMQMLQKVINTSNNKLNQFLEQFKDKGILDYVKGEKGKRGFTFELKLGDGVTVTDNHVTVETNNNGMVAHNITNNYQMDKSEVIALLKQLNGRIDKLETLYQDLKNSLIRQAEKIGNLETEIMRINQRLDNMEYIITSHDE